MSDYLALASGFVAAIFALVAYSRHQDAFHPAVFTAPLMVAGYCIWPIILNWEGELEALLAGVGLGRIQFFYLLGLLAFYIGIVGRRGRYQRFGREISPWKSLSRTVVGTVARGRLVRLSVLLAVVANLAFWESIENVGGFDAAYSRFKGGGVASSGYLGEAYLLAYPSVLVYALSRQGRGFRIVDWILVLVFLSPNLIQGTFGVRRGPLFISLATIFVSWIVSRGRVPGLLKTGIGLTLILLAVVFMWSQRRIWFEYEPGNTTQNGLSATLLPDSEKLIENDYVSGVGSALITDYYNGYFWGRRWFVDLIIRPIPRQFWPNKYIDVGAYWKEGGNPTGFEEHEQIAVLGFPLPRGHSIGVLSDLYSEWWWFALVVLFALGRFLRWLWIRHRTVGQVWTALYLAALGLCIYLPTQSFSAWYQRYLIMAVGTLIAWRWLVGRDVRARAKTVAGSLTRSEQSSD